MGRHWTQAGHFQVSNDQTGHVICKLMTDIGGRWTLGPRSSVKEVELLSFIAHRTKMIVIQLFLIHLTSDAVGFL